jgi:hypothetical protein
VLIPTRREITVFNGGTRIGNIKKTQNPFPCVLGRHRNSLSRELTNQKSSIVIHQSSLIFLFFAFHRSFAAKKHSSILASQLRL